MNLTKSQKLVCERIVNVFETGTVCGDYGDISVYPDGPGGRRQVTFGRSQTTEYGNLCELVEMYADAGGVYSDALRPYVAKIGKTALVDNATFKTLLRRAGHEDPIMQQTQDAFFDKRYFQPALEWATKNGFTHALSMLVIYDSFIHSGGILGFLRTRFAEKVPEEGGNEQTWIAEYVRTRNNWLATHSNIILRGTVYRTECFAHEIEHGNWDLTQLPIGANGTAVSDSDVIPATPKPSDDVKWLQAALNKLGFQLAVDGYDGFETRTAVMTFQQQHDLVVDGIAGVNTLAAIKALLPTTQAQQESSIMSKIFLWFLSNSQIQSLVRTSLHSAGVLLFARFGLAASGVDVVLNPLIDVALAAVTGGSGLFLSAQNASPNISNPARVQANPTPQA